MSNIKVMRSLHIKGASLTEVAQVADVAYASRDRNVLLESIFIGKRHLIRRSEDNGMTWKVVEEWMGEEPIENGLVLERSLPLVYCDPDNGLLLRVFVTNNHKPGVIPWDYAISPMARTWRIFTQVSHNEGLTWSKPRQLIVQGDEYDKVHWMDGVYYGKNGRVITGRIIKNHKGILLAPYCGARLFENGDIINPRISKDMANPDGEVQWLSGCFVGHWREDGSDLDWSAGNSMTLPRKYSCDGGDEPSFDYLSDNRLFMILRARTFPHTRQELPSLHYYALSSDDGMTWSEPEPLLYDDGSYAYSPACLANVFRSGKNGRFYVITNFSDAPCYHCDPRTKLYIAEIDMNTLSIKKDTLTIIEQQDKEAGQPDTIRFSNFRWYEDRETGNIVLYMTTSPGNVGWSPGCNVPPHSYRYDICIPE